MLRPLSKHAAVPLVVLALPWLVSWADPWVLRFLTAMPVLIQPTLSSSPSIESGILFVLQ
ncbi:MAG: hypothetical protein RJA69_446 [Pseudomonadota bacterium]|jgi:hypothetical protein